MMDVEIGRINILTIAEEKDFGLLLQAGDKRILLPRKDMPELFNIGDRIEVFIYRDSEDRVIATTRRPLAMAGEFACLTVRQINRIGAFLDWGLEKDLFLPPRLQMEPVAPGQRIVVRVMLDNVSGRLLASTKFNSAFDRNMKDLNAGKKVRTLVYGRTERGWRVIIEDRWQGMIYHNDFFQEPEIGDRIEAFVKKTRNDGLVDCTLRKSGFNEVKEKAPDILQMLKEKDGSLPYHDKTPPEVIAEVFGMSKKTFKKSIGTLKKKGKIEIDKDGIRLL